MVLLDDPAEWILIGMAASVHLTVVINRRATEPIQWKNLMFAAIPWLCCALPLSGWGAWGFEGIVWPFLVPLICATFLACRAPDLWSALGVTVVGLIAGSVLTSVASEAVVSGRYTTAGVRWMGPSPSQTLTDLETLGDESYYRPIQPKPAGYLRDWAIKLPSEFYIDEDDSVRYESVRNWHSFFTGLYDFRRRAYRIWTPGGTVKEMVAGARLVDVTVEGPALPKGTLPGVPLEPDREIPYYVGEH